MIGKIHAVRTSPTNATAMSKMRLVTRTAGRSSQAELARTIALGAEAGNVLVSRYWAAVEASVVMIRLSVPGTLKYRALVLRVVASSCKLLRSEAQGLQEASHELHHELHGEEFDAQVVSAIGEAFNNIAIHGYGRASAGDVQDVQIEIGPLPDGIELCMMDHGVTFDLSLAEPTRPSNEPDQLPESGMGLFIIRSFMDTVAYRASTGPEQPNVLRLTKRFPPHDSVAAPAAKDAARGLPESRSEAAQGTRPGK